MSEEIFPPAGDGRDTTENRQTPHGRWDCGVAFPPQVLKRQTGDVFGFAMSSDLTSQSAPETFLALGRGRVIHVISHSEPQRVSPKGKYPPHTMGSVRELRADLRQLATAPTVCGPGITVTAKLNLLSFDEAIETSVGCGSRLPSTMA